MWGFNCEREESRNEIVEPSRQVNKSGERNERNLVFGEKRGKQQYDR